jgi:isopentenyldiphosphate isomerase
MINNKELLFVVDKDNKPIRPKTRRETHAKGYWHRTAHIWIVNRRGEVLCQQRSQLKDRNPGLWEPFFGGHLAPGEEYSEGAIKELNEELGIAVNKKELIYFDTSKSEKAKEFQGVFFHVWNSLTKLLRLEKEEVAQVKWFKISLLKNIMNDQKLEWVIPAYGIKFLSYLEQQNLRDISEGN